MLLYENDFRNNLSLDEFERSKISIMMQTIIDETNNTIPYGKEKKYNVDKYSPVVINRDRVKISLRIYNQITGVLKDVHFNPYAHKYIRLYSRLPWNPNEYGYSCTIHSYKSHITYKYMRLLLGKLRISRFKGGNV